MIRCFLLVMLFPGLVLAADKNGQMWVQGAASCGQYVEARTARVASAAAALVVELHPKRSRSRRD